MDTQVAIIGCGPHGLATAAHLRAYGIEPTVFGDPMQFWRDQMPAGMLLRSSRRASYIADPVRRMTLEDWADVSGRERVNPVPIEDFIEYGLWFQREAVPQVDRRYVRSLERAAEGGFALTLEDGDSLTAEKVVVAAGIAFFPRVPAGLDTLPSELASHSSAHKDLGVFRGRRVGVVGGGQSALESAALLAETGADVELLIRGDSIWWLGGPPSGRFHWPTAPTDIGGRITSWLAASPDIFRRLPRSRQPELAFRCIRPAGAHWLRDRLKEVPMHFERTVETASANGSVRVGLSDGAERQFDHLLVATGYEIDVRRYPFLGPGLAGELEVEGGYPVLRRGLESSVAGLHFVGAPAAYSFGPVMRFVTGTWYSAPSAAAGVAGRRQRLVRWSF